MKANLTAIAQAQRVGKARMDYYNLTHPHGTKAARFHLRRVDANGRAASYVCDLLSAREAVLLTEYLGVFYEHRTANTDASSSHVRIDYPDGSYKYSERAVPADAEWQVFAKMAGIRVKNVIDLMDTEVAGVRRISFTVPSTLEQFTIHVASLR